MSRLVGRHVRLFSDGRNQVIRIPGEFELPGDEVVVRKEGTRIIIEPLKKKSLIGLLSTWSSTNEEFPDVDERLSQLDDVKV